MAYMNQDKKATPGAGAGGAKILRCHSGSVTDDLGYDDQERTY
jgi:hypothetical protein